jgi:hypothetical protein
MAAGYGFDRDSGFHLCFSIYLVLIRSEFAHFICHESFSALVCLFGIEIRFQW